MNGKIIVVTGASGALGQVVVELAIARGAVIAAIDHAAKTPASTSTLLQIGGVDLSDAAQADQAIAAAAKQLSGIDALINIAGACAFEAIDGGSNDSWERMHRLNLLTALNASRAAIPHLVQSKAGRIVNIGAIGALQAGAGMGPYAASKSAVHRLTEALAAELKGKVTVNAVLPSTIDTPANRRDMPNADFAKWVTAQELAEAILFLASDAASAITGALLPVSGRV
ncbi:MAG: 3-oxoacyl-[acyl-carrier-protein] reductase [Tardiphaga sp.]|uniref:3-oxoacyl-ACP reductase FabG n=1 Tax=Tardiphaga sp. TaxID=1926292 RepID=UPI002633C85E|nr:3-oxoacyl-ACP reductase FabG [Tardiphaga sp.]MDB5501659.1 3-oxoacyl-[acyl-carrier-protein] reductase [Tardiphaga sp.]